MIKADELRYIDEFVNCFNKYLSLELGNLVRVSDENQENPDAILVLGDKKRIGLEATKLILPEDRSDTPSRDLKVPYDPFIAINRLIGQISKKALNDYKDSEIEEIWLLIRCYSPLSHYDFHKKIEEGYIPNPFDRIYIHGWLNHGELCEITNEES